MEISTGGGVVIDPVAPEAVELSYPILDPTGRVLGDASVILGTALAHWERELAALR